MKTSRYSMETRHKMASRGTLRRTQKAGPQPATNKARARYVKTKFRPSQGYWQKRFFSQTEGRTVPMSDPSDFR